MSTSRDHELEASELDEQRAVARRTARGLGVAVSLLCVSLLVVVRSERVLEPAEASAAAGFRSAEIELTDDDAGVSLFSPGPLLPGWSDRQCIRIVYRGDHLPVEVRLQAEARGRLARALEVAVDAGTGGGFGDCGGFRREARLFEGTLAQLAAATSGEGLLSFTATEPESARTFAVEVRLPDDATGTAGQTATAQLTWRAS